MIFVDCEVNGKSPSSGKLTEFVAVAYPSRTTFHGVLVGKKSMDKKEVFEEFYIKAHRSWKGYPFEILDQLREEDCITGSKSAKSVYLTKKGTTKAKELMVKYVREK